MKRASTLASDEGFADLRVSLWRSGRVLSQEQREREEERHRQELAGSVSLGATHYL